MRRSFDILVTDRETIENGLLVRTTYALISIRDPEKRRVRYRKSTLLRQVLELQFHDAEPTEKLKLPENIRLITDQDAAKIWTFVQDLPDEVLTLVVHCEQGMSRSPAVAAAICQGLGGDPKMFFQTYQPNRFVFDIVIKAREQNTSGRGKDCHE